MTYVAAILGAALAVTLFLLLVVCMGSAQLLAEERKLADRYRRERDEARVVQRALEHLAHSEAARADWRTAERWSQP